MTQDPTHPPRRMVLGAGLALAAGAGLVLSGCGKAKEENGILATEDLMREHGLLRRVTSLFRETAPNVRINPGAIDMMALAQATDLFRSFGEDYHEKKLEEDRVFPAVRKAGGEAAGLIDTLIQQHARGRELTAYIHAKCMGSIGPSDTEPLARALESMARMYDEHTAFEETIIFPAWRKTMSEHELKETSEEFEKIEQAQFKGDGFEKALAEIKQLEQRVGLVHLQLFTAPPPASDAPAPTNATARGASS